MATYAQFRPTGFDCAGLGLDDRQDWLVAPVSQNRDSGCLALSNFAAALEILGGESETVEVHRFNHWANGWFEIILVSPERGAEIEEIESSLENYPVLNDFDFSRRENEEAENVWRDCYRERDRIEYIRKHRSQFEFRNLADMLGCVRGNYFAGYASELIA